MSSTVVFDGGVARRIIPPAPSPSAGPISPHLPRGPPENEGGLSSVPTLAPLIGVASAPGPVLASRTAATAAAARQKMAFLSDAVSPSSETSFNRLNSIRDYGPTISDIRVPCPKPYLPKHTLSSVDAWGAPKRCATEFAESEGDSSLEWLVRALPPPLPPPVLLQRSAPASLESARSKLEPTTLVQSVTTTFSGNASAIIQQATFPCPTGLSFSASTNSAGCTTKGMSPALSPEQPTKMPPKEDKSTQPEIQSEEEDVESVAKAVAPDAAFSAPNAQYTLFNLISRMTKSLGDANSLTQPAAGDAPVTPRPGSAAAAAVAAAAAAAAATFASSGAYGGETDDQPPPFVFECNSEATAESSSSSSDSDDEDDDEDEDEDDIEDDADTHPKTTGGEETQKTPSQTLSEFLRAISKENGELESNAGATLRPGASGGACGGSRAVAGVCRAGGRSSSPRRPLQSQRAAARGRRHAKQRSQQRRGRRGARSRGASAYAAAARGASGASRRRRTSRSRASRRASVTSHASKMKPAVSVKSQSSVKTPRGGPIASEDDASPGATTTGTTGSEESPRSYADVLDRLARQDSSLLLRARRTTEKRRRAAAGGARKGEGGAGRRARAQKPAARSVGGGGAAGRSAAGASAAGAALSAAAPPRPGASPVGRVPRLDAAAATVATTAGRSPGQGPPAPPPSPASSKRSAVAAYASNPMLVPPGETQEAGDCSEDSLAFWLRIICGPQRDGEAVDSLVRSQQPSVSPRKCALGAAKTIWARAEPPCPASTQPPPPPGPPAPPAATCATTVSPRRGGKLPVYALPKVSDTSATVSCGQSGHAQAQSAAPIWNTTFPRPSKCSTRHSNPSQPQCLAQWDRPLPAPAAPVTPSVAKTTRAPHRCALGDQLHLEGTHRCHRPLGAKGDAAWPCAADACERCCGDCAAGRARRKAWVRALAKRRSWMRQRVSAHALLARPCYKRLGLKGHAAATPAAGGTLAKTDHACGGKEGNGSRLEGPGESSRGPDSPRREACSAPVLARAGAGGGGGARVGRTIRERRAQAGNSGCGYMSVSMASACCAGGGGGGGGGCGGGCGGAGASGARRTTQRRLRCAFTSVGGGGAPHRTQSPSKAHAPLSLHPPHQQPPPPPPPRNLQPICCIPTSPPSPTQTTLLTSQLFINPADLLCTPTPLPHHSKNTHLPASSPAPALSSPLLPTGTLSPPPMVHCPPPSTPSTPPSQARGSHSHGAQRQAGRRVPRNSTAYALGSQSQGATDASAAFCGGYSDVAAAVAAAAVTRTGVRSRGRDVILVECMPRRGAADGPRAHRRVKDSDGPPTRGHSQRSASPAVASLHRHREQAVNREGDGPAVGGAAARAQAAASSRRVTRSRHKECSGAGAQRSSSPAPPTPTTPPHAHAPTSKHRSSRPPRAQRPAKQRAHADDVARVGKSSVKTPVSTTSSTGASAARPRPLTDDSESAEKSGSRRVKSRNTKMPASSEGRSQRLDEYRSSAGTSVKRAHGRVHSNTRLQSSKARSTRGGGACDRSHGSSEGAAAGGGGKKSRRHARRSGPQLETRASSKRSVPRKDERERESEAPPEAEASLLQLFFATEMYSSHTESERSGSEHDGRAAWSVPMMVPMVMPMAVPMALPMAMPVAVPLVSSEEGVASRQSSKRSVDVSRHGSSWSDPQVKTSETVCKPLCASPSQRQLCSNVSEEDNRIHHVPPVVKIKQCRKNEVTGKSTELVISVIKDGVLVTIEEPSESSSQSKGSNHVLRANSLSIVEITSNDVTNILDSSSTKSVTKRSNQSDTDAQPINREINATSNEASLVSQCTISTSSVTSPLLNGSSLTANETPLKLTEREATQGENDTDANHSEESEKNSETQPQPKLSERNSPTLTPGLDVQTKSYKDDRSTSDGEKLDIIGYTFHQLPSGHGSMKEVLPEENTINFIQKCSNTSATISRNKTTPHKSDISTKLERFSDDNDPFDHLPTTSRNTLVTAWNTRAYMKSTIDSECSSNVDTYSLICSRSTPSVTESYHDLRLTSTSSTDYSTLRNDEENSPFLSTFASRNRLFLSSVIYKASEPPPFSGIQSHFIPCVDSSEEDKLSLGTPDKSSSYEDASFVSQEESIEETAESKHPQEETVHEIINLQKGIDHPTSYAYSINNLLCSSDDSMGVDLPYNSSGAQRVCLVLSRSTFSQGESNPSVSETNTSESSAHENQAVVQSPTHICSGGEQGQLKDPTKGDECNTQLMNGAPENEYTSLTLHPSVTEGYTTQGLESLLWSGGALSTGIGGGDEEVESLATVSSSELEAEEAGAAGDVRKAEGRASTPASGDSRRSSPAARSVATSEQSRGKASLTLIVHDSDESLPEVDGVDDVAVLLLEPLERETRLAHRRQRAVGLAPDLVSDLPTLGGGGQRSPGRRRDLDRGRCRYRDLLTQVQQLEAHKRPESAPASGVELRASDRLASPSPKVRDRIQIYEYNHATAKATLRPSSAQRDVDLANSSTKVKERIKAFNTGKVSQEEKKQCSSGGPGICLAKRSPRQEVGHHDRNLRSVANSTASEFQLADVKVAEGCGAAAASSAGAAPAPPFSTPCALFADSRDSVSREEVLSGDRSHDDGCSRAAEWQTASVGAGDGARVSAGEKKLERRSTGASAGVEGVTHSPEGRNRTFSVLVATLAAAYLWYNMYVS